MVPFLSVADENFPDFKIKKLMTLSYVEFSQAYLKCVPHLADFT